MNKKMWKKVSCLGLAAIMSMGMLSGVVNAAEEEVVEIDFWHHYPSGEGAELMTSLLERFMEEHPNIKVNELGLGLGEQSEKIAPALIAGTAPDIMVYDLSTVQERAMKGQTMSLQSYVEEAGLDLSVYFPETVEICTYDGELYGLPYMTDTRVLYYNKQHFIEAGLDPDDPPTTWEEVLEYNEKLTVVNENGETERVGMSTQIYEMTPWILGWSFGAELWNEDGSPNINSAEMLEALEFAIQLQNQTGSAFESLYEDSMASGITPFVNETASMCIQYNGFYSTIETYNPDLDFGVALIPTKDGENYKSSWGAGYSLEFCYKDEARAQAAFELGMYLCSAEVGTEFILTTSDYVCNMESYEDPEVQADPVWQVFAESGQYTKLHHFCEELPTWHWGTLLPEWQSALLGNKTPEQALEDAQNNILTEIENYRLMNGE